MSSSKKIGHSNSLRRKCFKKLNLRSDSYHTSADQASSTCQTSDDQVLITASEDADCKQSPKPKRKLASATPNTPSSSLFINRSISGSSIDSGVGSLPHSKRPSRESSNAAEIASPLLESRQPFSCKVSGAERLSIDGYSRGPSQLSESCMIGEPTGILNSQTEGILFSSTTDDEVDDLTKRTDRLSITRDTVDVLQIAIRKLLDDISLQPETECVQRQTYLNDDFKSSVESDSPSFPRRRHSSADPDIPLTQRLSRKVERKRSAQPFFHRSMEDGGNSGGNSATQRRRKSSACIVCGRKRRDREPSKSAQSVIVKTVARFPGHSKRRRYSEVLKVKPSEIPFTEVRVMTIEELKERETDTPNFQRLPRKQASSLPRSLFSSQSRLKQSDLVRDEQLQFILERYMPKFLEYTDWIVLFGHLVSRQLLSSECREILLCPLKTNITKGNYFYGQILPKMGRESGAYIKLCECLDDTKTEHLGHGTLIDIFSKGLQRYFYDKYIMEAEHFQEAKSY